METNKLDIKVKLIHGFSNKTRLLILESIKENEKTVSQIVEDINGNQSNISQHLACLKGCGIIVGRNEGKYCYYRLRNDHIKELLTMVDVVLSDVEKDITCCDNHIL
ncbi:MULTISPECIES: ArsR/SmtB family transcription factor [Oceanobacillus]|uniref:Transcriptional regulator n=1 Tax=Oceanobacillus kimchii TaxID=746691 RepID=A0ABQ5TQX8_9BACI|nr:metalloregulator ArsR/SmtB family transcription factor [Oceanobacillus kimchii]GLO68321.1 transcriptional regulator [Oceanobacillus kimchii]